MERLPNSIFARLTVLNFPTISQLRNVIIHVAPFSSSQHLHKIRHSWPNLCLIPAPLHDHPEMIVQSSRNCGRIARSRGLLAVSHLDDNLGSVSDGHPRHRVRHQLFRSH